MQSDHGSTLEQVRWQPPGGYALDLEVLSIAELRRRGSAAHFARPQRVQFHVLTAITSGHCRHVIDFVPHACSAGTWMMVNPGQMQRYDFAQPWAGWSVVFRPELLLPRRDMALIADRTLAEHLSAMPSAFALSPLDHARCTTIVRQMLADASSAASIADRNALLRLQVYQLLLRLKVALAQQLPTAPLAPANVQRVLQFRRNIERHLRRHHDIHHYALLQGCTDRTLTRATLAVSGIPAKTMLMARIALEAKRLLVHTDLPVQAIADELGFDESTNFVKFFRRVEGCSPGRFRRQQAAGGIVPTQTP